MDIFGNTNIIGPRSIIHFDTNLTSEHPYNGFITREIIGESVSNRNLLFYDYTILKWVNAIANSYNKIPCVGIALASGLSGDIIPILRYGYVFSTTWHFSSKLIYVSDITSGSLTTTIPSTNGSLVQQIGYALSSQVAFFDFNTTVIECTNY